MRRYALGRGFLAACKTLASEKRACAERRALSFNLSSDTQTHRLHCFSDPRRPANVSSTVSCKSHHTSATAPWTSSTTMASAASCRRAWCARRSPTCPMRGAKSSRRSARRTSSSIARWSRGAAATTSTRSRSTTPVAAQSCRRSFSASRRRDGGRCLLRRARGHSLLGISHHRLVRRRGGRSGRLRRLLRLLRGPSGASGEESKLLVWFLTKTTPRQRRPASVHPTTPSGP